MNRPPQYYWNPACDKIQRAAYAAGRADGWRMAIEEVSTYLHFNGSTWQIDAIRALQPPSTEENKEKL